MNVAENTLHRGSQPLELGDQYWSIRDAIVQAELLIMRMLKFQVISTHPHKVIHFSPSFCLVNQLILNIILAITYLFQ